MHLLREAQAQYNGRTRRAPSSVLVDLVTLAPPPCVAPTLVEPKMPLPPLLAGVGMEPWPPFTAEDWWLVEEFIVFLLSCVVLGWL